MLTRPVLPKNPTLVLPFKYEVFYLTKAQQPVYLRTHNNNSHHHLFFLFCAFDVMPRDEDEMKPFRFITALNILHTYR